MKPEFNPSSQEWSVCDRGRGFTVTQAFVEIAYPQYLKDCARYQQRHTFFTEDGSAEPLLPLPLASLEDFIVVLAEAKWRQQGIEPVHP